MAFGGLVFQFMGSVSSRDLTVIKLTAIGSVHEPILILVSLLFAHMIKSSTNKLDTSPVYRRTMIESRKSSLSDLFASPNLDRRSSGSRDNNWTLNRQGTSRTLTATSERLTRVVGSTTINNNSLAVPSNYNRAFVSDEI